RGRDGRTIGSVVRFRQPPDVLTADSARWRFPLANHAPRSFEWEVLPDDPPFAVEQRYRTWRKAGSRWTTDLPKFDVVLRRATDDLRALYMEVDGEEVISAGIPWYATVF